MTACEDRQDFSQNYTKLVSVADASEQGVDHVVPNPEVFVAENVRGNRFSDHREVS
ncbi:hypothetical protein ROS1_57560 [Roseibium sp. ROS1]